MRRSDLFELAELLRKLMKDEAGAKSIAADLGKPYFTLMHEIAAVGDPGDEPPRHKLGLVTTLQLLDLLAGGTGGRESVKPFLDLLNRHFGYLPAIHRPAPHVDGHDLHRTLARVSEEVGDVARALRIATSAESEGGTQITPDELKRFRRECEEAVAVLVELDEQARTLWVKGRE